MLVVTSIVTSGLITTSAASGNTVYCETDGFEPYCYMWIDGNTNNSKWPGVKMTKVKDNIYSYTLDNDYVKIIFSYGSGNQTGDMTYPGDNRIYNFSTGKWSVYDVSASKPVISASDIETNGIGVMKISTFGTSGMDSLPYDPSMSDNADKAYSKQEPNSQEKEDEDNITVPLARIGKALSGGNVDPTVPTTTPVPTTEPTTAPITTEPTTAPIVSVILGDANGDSLITVADATFIQKHIAGINTGYNIGSAI